MMPPVPGGAERDGCLHAADAGHDDIQKVYVVSAVLRHVGEQLRGRAERRDGDLVRAFGGIVRQKAAQGGKQKLVVIAGGNFDHGALSNSVL